MALILCLCFCLHPPSSLPPSVTPPVPAPAAHPYIWIKDCRALPTGLGIACEGREKPLAALPPVEGDKVKAFPLVWRNPATGAPCLQVHPCCVADLVVDGVPMGGDLPTIRAIVDALVRPGIAPARVLAHDWAEGDLCIFSNRTVTHTVCGTLKPSDVRVYTQCNLAASDAPPVLSAAATAELLAATGFTREQAAAAVPGRSPGAASASACARGGVGAAAKPVEVPAEGGGCGAGAGCA